ncbi:Hypothetical protein EIN_415910, partial [Entamoeba invadens IP1]
EFGYFTRGTKFF